jgi:hypothetical protein
LTVAEERTEFRDFPWSTAHYVRAQAVQAPEMEKEAPLKQEAPLLVEQTEPNSVQALVRVLRLATLTELVSLRSEREQQQEPVCWEELVHGYDLFATSPFAVVSSVRTFLRRLLFHIAASAQNVLKLFSSFFRI